MHNLNFRDPRMIFGFSLLILLAILAAVIAIGHVEERTSYGLQFLLGALVNASGHFSQWAFSSPKSKDDEGKGSGA